MNTGPICQVTSIAFENLASSLIRTILATQTLRKGHGLAVTAGSSNRYTRENLQATKEEDAGDSPLLTRGHVECEYSGDGHNQDDDIDKHVHDAKCQEECIDINTFALGAYELVPEEGDRFAGICHCYPYDQRNTEGEEEADGQDDLPPTAIVFENATVKQ